MSGATRGEYDVVVVGGRRLAQTVHTYPSWSMAVQQAAAQSFFEIGGRAARPAVR